MLINLRYSNEKLQVRACKQIEVEFQKVLRKIPKLRDIQECDFNNRCQILALHFNVNIVIHQWKYEIDSFAFIQLPTKKDYDVSLERENLLASRTGDFNEEHVSNKAKRL